MKNNSCLIFSGTVSYFVNKKRGARLPSLKQARRRPGKTTKPWRNSAPQEINESGDLMTTLMLLILRTKAQFSKKKQQHPIYVIPPF
jgi:hypothetical protein